MKDQRRKNIRRQLAKEGIEITEDSIQARTLQIEQKKARVTAEKKAYTEAVGLKPITTKYVKSQLRQQKRPINPDTVAAHWTYLTNRRERIAQEAKLGTPRTNKVYWLSDSYIVCILRRAGIPVTSDEINNRRQRIIEGRAYRALPLSTRKKLYQHKYRTSEKCRTTQAHARDSLCDYYVRSALEMTAAYCPPELIELKRIQLNINRKLKALNEKRI